MSLVRIRDESDRDIQRREFGVKLAIPLFFFILPGGGPERSFKDGLLRFGILELEITVNGGSLCCRGANGAAKNGIRAVGRFLACLKEGGSGSGFRLARGSRPVAALIGHSSDQSGKQHA